MFPEVPDVLEVLEVLEVLDASRDTRCSGYTKYAPWKGRDILLRTLFTVHKSFVVCKYYPFAGIRM